MKVYLKDNETHQCPICKNYHEGDYQLCAGCIEKGENKKPEFEEYDYAADDFNFRAAREKGRR